MWNGRAVREGRRSVFDYGRQPWLDGKRFLGLCGRRFLGLSDLARLSRRHLNVKSLTIFSFDTGTDEFRLLTMRIREAFW